MWISDKWNDYELLDCSCGEKLERWGRYILVRPDPQEIWRTHKKHPGWQNPDARYIRSQSGGGKWESRFAANVQCEMQSVEFEDGDAEYQIQASVGCTKKTEETTGVTESGSRILDKWRVSYDDLVFNVSLMNFKHTGLFPEQAANWEYIAEKIKSAGRNISVLNLFAYTGGATLAAASAGAVVCHVDAARGMVMRARENAQASGLGEKPIRWIVDDCAGFVQREVRRGRRYDAIIMDPPSYGRGPGGEVWKLEDSIYDFVKNCSGVLSDDPLFVLINSYTAGLSPSVLAYMAQALLGGHTECDELGLPVSASGFALPCGSSCRWEPGA